MTLTEAELHIINSRQKLAACDHISDGLHADTIMQMARDEIVQLEIVAQSLPGRAVKIHRLIQQWRLRQRHSHLADTV